MSRSLKPKETGGRRIPPAPRSIGHYTLGESIGKGGFGTVYRGLNTETGDFVAIKQVSLANIPKEELANIMMEIDLLKKLKHNNIVKYLGFIKTKEHLNILLEYIDCGSLANVIKKFGAIPEQLVSIYIEQVLVGLEYLHEQGVIHRDVKGANILTSSAGHVKLADFGVATKLGAIDRAQQNCVVGSPYWMAPEVIEMSAPSTASDIWSVGCTVIELLTGAPPYFELEPMPALFRIVQDDMPPLPDSCSAALKDFLQQCFQKDSNLRVSAQQLLRHQWIASRNRAKKPNAMLPSAGHSGVQWGDAAMQEMIGRTIELNKHSGEFARPGLPLSASRRRLLQQQQQQQQSSPQQSPQQPSPQHQVLAAHQSQQKQQHGEHWVTSPKGTTQEPPRVRRSSHDGGEGRRPSIEGSEGRRPSVDGGEGRRQSAEGPDGRRASVDESSRHTPGGRPQQRFPASVTSSPSSSPPASPRPQHAGLPPAGAGRPSRLHRSPGGEHAFPGSPARHEGPRHLRSGSFSARTAFNGAGPFPASVQEEDEEDWDREIEEEERSGSGPTAPRLGALGLRAAAADERSGPLSSRTSASAATDRDSCPTQSIGFRPSPELLARRAPPGLGWGGPMHMRTASLDTATAMLGQPPPAASPARPALAPHAEGMGSMMLSDRERPPQRPVRPVSVSASASPMASPRQVGRAGPAGRLGAPRSGLLAYAEVADESYDDFVSDDGDAVEERIRQRHDLKPRAKLQLIRPEDMRYLDPLLRAPPHLVKQDSQKLAQYQDGEERYDDMFDGDTPFELPAVEAADEDAGSESEGSSGSGEEEGRRRRRRCRPGVETPRGPTPEAGGSVRAGGAIGRLRHNLENKIREKMSREWDEGGGGGVEDPFDVDLEADEDAQESGEQRTDVFGAAGGEVVKLIATLQPSESEDVILAACAKLVGIFREQPLAKGHLITHRGVIPIMEMLDTENSRILHAVLQVVNQIIEGNAEFKENLCLVGVIPLVMRFAAPSQPTDVRLQAAQFVRQMCTVPTAPPGSSLTLQMFIACKGLPTLVGFLEPPYARNRALVHLAIDAVWKVFELQSPTPKNDFCRLFAKCGLLERLVVILLSILDDAPVPARDSLLDGASGSEGSGSESGREAAEWEGPVERIADLFLLFSHADSVVKAYMSTPQVLRRVLRALSSRAAPASVLVKLLRCVKNLSLDPNALEPLQRAGALAPLVRFLAARDGPHMNEVHNQVLNTLYNLCKINRARQEQAAVAGVVPHLMRIIERNSPLKQFAIPVLCDFAHAGRRARGELWRHRGLEFYLSLLTVPDCWQVNAIDAIAVWLAEEQGRVEEVLSRPDNVEKLLRLFRSPSNASLARILEPFDRIIKVARRVNEALGESELVGLLLAPLPRADARVRVNLLKTVLDLHAAARDRRAFAVRHDLPAAVHRVAANERAVLVVELADKLCKLCEADLAAPAPAPARFPPADSPASAASPSPQPSSPYFDAAPSPGDFRRIALPAASNGPPAARLWAYHSAPPRTTQLQPASPFGDWAAPALPRESPLFQPAAAPAQRPAEAAPAASEPLVPPPDTGIHKPPW